MSDKKFDVFIAYPGEETKLATDLCTELKLLGLRVFLDTDLVPGSDFMRDIPAALAQTHVVAVLLTSATPNGWYDKSEVVQAIQGARNQTLHVVPIHVEDANPLYGLEQLTPIKCRRDEHHRVAILLYHAVRECKGGADAALSVKSANASAAPPASSGTSSQQARRDSNFWAIPKGLEKKPGKSPWSKAIKSMSLWPEKDNESLLRTISEGVADFAFDRAPHTGDPWFDLNYPIRVLDRLGDLSDQIGHLALNEAEVAALVCAVYFREAAYGAALGWLEKAAPSALATGNEGTSDHPEAARLVAAASLSSPLLKRRWTQFHNTGRQDELRAMQSWLTRKAAARYTGQWQMPNSGTLPAFPIPPLLSQAHPSQLAGALAIFTQQRMTRLARCVRCDPGRIFPADDDFQLEVAVLLDHDLPPLRERLLGVLLCMAGWLALDIRSTDDTFAEHVGASGGFPPADMCRFLNTCTWQRVGDTLELTGACPHPLADRTVEILVDQAYAAISAMAALIAKHGVGLKERVRLPIRLSPDGVVPSGKPGDVPYIRPHLHFQLSTGEIRELLMGEKLYGDPDVAIRELYQNALDACRYAKARTDYVARVSPVRWSGQITFRQGVDFKTNRRFLECEDTGIGMGERELVSCFAQAGRRFADLPEFLEEQELWRKLKEPIEFVPNSQFGIGVLSYFMISDDIEVTSCRMTDKGEAGAVFSVRIPGSGSLFQLQNLGKGERTGTKVRLYLREDWQGDCEQVLLKWLVVAEFETAVINDGANTRAVWQPGTPVLASEDERTKRWVVVPRQLSASPDLDFWWSKIPDGLVLADGIRVAAERMHESGDGRKNDFKPWSSIINLRGRRRPALTVDRRKLLLPFPMDYYDQILTRHAEGAAAVEGIDFTWLWRLAGESKNAADQLVKYLSANGRRLPVNANSDDLPASHYPVSTIGLHERDDPIALQWISLALVGSFAGSPFRRLQVLRGITIEPRDPQKFTLDLIGEITGKDGTGPSERDVLSMFDEEFRWRPMNIEADWNRGAEFGENVWRSINRGLTSLWWTNRENRESRDAVILSGGPVLLPEALCDPSALYEKRSYDRFRERWLRDPSHEPWRSRERVPVGNAFIPSSAAQDWAHTELAKLQKQCEASAAAGKPDAWTIIGHRAAVWIAAGHRAPAWISDYLPPFKLAESQRAVVISKPRPIASPLSSLAAIKTWYKENKGDIAVWSIIGTVLVFASVGLIGSILAAWRWLTG